MSDDILTIATPYPDVVSLAQGYINRADGERILLPLAATPSEGEGIRFVVMLSDGTPAFAGAGLCTQVSDQGNTVPADQRFETLLDSLQFDERSQPVYDYIVAVRNAAYAQQAETEAQAAEAPATDVEMDALSVESHDDEATAMLNVEVATEAVVIAGRMPSDAPSEQGQVLWSAGAPEAAQELEPVHSWAPSAPPPPRVESWQPPLEAAQPSFVPPPIPTGILTRPARAAHWQPTPPRRPTPRPASGLFRYASGALPRPAAPPHPDIDPAARVRPAPRP